MTRLTTEKDGVRNIENNNHLNQKPPFLIMSLEQQYNLHDINWKTKHKQPATPEDTWAWTFAYNIDGTINPITGALVDDLREKDHIDIPHTK